MKPRRQRIQKYRKPLTRKSAIKGGTKKIPKNNKAALRRKLARYKAYMASPEWKAKREEALERAGYTCEALVHEPDCELTKCLTVHHLRYTNFGRERPNDLQVLTKPCHDAAERRKGCTPLWRRAS